MFFTIPLLALVASVVARPPLELAPGSAHDFGVQSPLTMVPVPDNNTRVPIVLGVMSRCPDALLCESLLNGVLLRTWGIVDVDLSFIGTINTSDTKYGVTCMHGPQECAGNVQELCAISRARSQEDWWNFVQCLNYEGKNTVGNKALAERCAGINSIPWDDEQDNSQKGIKKCIENNEGKSLLKNSVNRSQALGIQKSCSIMISRKIRCVHDGTWKDCETGHTEDELVQYIQDEYQRLQLNDTIDPQQ